MLKDIRTIKNYNFFKDNEDYTIPNPKSDVGNHNTNNVYMELTGNNLAISNYEIYPGTTAAPTKN